MDSQHDELLNEKQTANMLNMAAGTIRRWRCAGYGPVYMKLGRSVRYHRSAVEAWTRDQCVHVDAQR